MPPRHFSFAIVVENHFATTQFYITVAHLKYRLLVVGYLFFLYAKQNSGAFSGWKNRIDSNSIHLVICFKFSVLRMCILDMSFGLQKKYFVKGKKKSFFHTARDRAYKSKKQIYSKSKDIFMALS